MISHKVKILFCASLITTFGWGNGVVASQKNTVIAAEGKEIRIEFDSRLYSRVVSRLHGREKILGAFSASEYLQVNGADIKDFALEQCASSDFRDSVGAGKEYVITSSAAHIVKVLTIKSYDNFPAMLLMRVKYTNAGSSKMSVDSWTNNAYQFSSAPRTDSAPSFWVYLPGSYGWSNDWIQPLSQGFERNNNLGMNWVDYGEELRSSISGGAMSAWRSALWNSFQRSSAFPSR